MFAIAYFNAQDDKNSKRAEAFKAGSHPDCMQPGVARTQLEKLLRDELTNWGKNIEKTQSKTAKEEALQGSLKMVANAPDVYAMAALIQRNKMSIGQGEFKKLIDFLCKSE